MRLWKQKFLYQTADAGLYQTTGAGLSMSGSRCKNLSDSESWTLSRRQKMQGILL